MNVLDLFSGIGGFSLGLKRAGMRTVAFCESDPFARAVLAKHWPNVPIHDDVRSLDGRSYRSVDLVCGGFPCQPFSSASRGRKRAVDLWGEMLRVVEEARPRFVVAENVQASPIVRATQQLRALGYRATHRRIGADDCGADHTRSRWWAIAHTDDESELHRSIHAEVAVLPALCDGVWEWRNYSRAIRVPDGVPNRMDRLRCLGNSVVPQVVEAIGRAIMRVDRGER